MTLTPERLDHNRPAGRIRTRVRDSAYMGRMLYRVSEMSPPSAPPHTSLHLSDIRIEWSASDHCRNFPRPNIQPLHAAIAQVCGCVKVSSV